MYFSKIIISLALAATPLFALPTVESTNDLAARNGVYTCKPKDNNSNIKSFTVSESRAIAQASAALYAAGKSGDPHKYGNGDNFQWGVKGCDKTGPNKHQLYEYPIYWDALKKEWKKNEISSSQSKTPLRVVYFEDKGNSNRPKICGVMTHSKVDKDYQGKDFFQKCTK